MKTRECIIKGSFWFSELEEAGQGSLALALVSDIFDEVESRTCGNCKYNDDLCTYQESIKVYSRVTRGEKYICDFNDFGCNRFEKG